MLAVIQTTDTLDKIIAVLIALFIMSVITEKITTLIRKYPRFCQIIVMLCSGYATIVSLVSLVWARFDRLEYLLIMLISLVLCVFSTTSLFVNTINKNKRKVSRTAIKLTQWNPLKNIAHDNKEVSEEVKSDEVTLLSFLVGFGVAFSFKADMMSMFTNGSTIDYGVWKISLLSDDSIWRFNPALVFDPSVFFGILTSGFFLSFGSKFFHDLIDTLLQVKDLRRKMNNRETYDVNKIEELEEFISVNDIDLARRAIEANQEALKKQFPNIMYISDTMQRIGDKTVAVAAIYLSDNNVKGLPSALPGRLDSGKTYSVPVEIVESVGIGKPHSGMTKTVAGRLSPGFTGSGCCLLTRDEDTFLLTCCHVLSENDVIDPVDEPTGKHVLCASKDIGEWVFSRMDSTGDFALAKIKDPVKFIKENKSFRFSNIHRVTSADYSKLRVTVEGSASGINGEAWVVDSLNKSVSIEYNGGTEIVFDQVILLGSSPNKNMSAPVTQVHDSGGSVYNNLNELIGIIVGANDKFSIVIPVESFFKNNNLTLI